MHPYPNPGGESDYDEDEPNPKLIARRSVTHPNSIVAVAHLNEEGNEGEAVYIDQPTFADFMDDIKAGVYDHLTEPDNAETLLRKLVEQAPASAPRSLPDRCFWCGGASPPAERANHRFDCLWPRAIYFVENTGEGR